MKPVTLCLPNNTTLIVDFVVAMVADIAPTITLT